MKILLDTNIVIHRETIDPKNKDIGKLFWWIDKLGYKITPIREALETTVNWYQDFIEKNGKKKKNIGIRCSQK